MSDQIIDEPAVAKLAKGDFDAWERLCDGIPDRNTRNALHQIGAVLAAMYKGNKARNQSIAEIKECSVGWPSLSFEVDERGRPALTLKKANTTIRQYIGLNDQGIYRSGASYVKGDVVTHNRSLFICRVDHPTGRPEDASGHWRLAVCRGIDGRNGKDATAPKEDDP